MILGTSAETSTIRQCGRTYLILMTKELLKVSIPLLAANERAYEEFTVILDGGDLLLTLALASWSGSAKHLQLVTTNGVIHCLCSVQQTLSGESLKLHLANPLDIHHGLHGSRMYHLLCVQFEYILTLLLEWVAHLLYDIDERANIFHKRGLYTWRLVMMKCVCCLPSPVLVLILEFFDHPGNLWSRNHPAT